ncbi:stage II sporulation protein P [Sporosarcina sp. ANT_H38]|uniref:stage II sporulation protein P n=1 Tax=Sporosarcina sp. ANT_H38 TaxID=2597358 RepID=UPI0011F11996|nr:stage II sporulation protein P [Sporosarcina sp. ANT_H38]KAA0965311.1 stage II sporulation protein P [Sporosarcina sp. ANT_H38]
MFPTAEKNKKENKKKTILLFLLYVATTLFMIWLLLVLFLTFFFKPDERKEKSLLDTLFSIADFEIDSIVNSLDEKDGSSIGMGEPGSSIERLNRDDFKPAMNDLLKDRVFDQARFDAVFQNMKSPIMTEKDPVHSTFGRDVIYIYHSHSRESFLPYLNETDKPEEAFHSRANITFVGELLGRALENRGVGTEVDSTDIVQELDFRGLDYGSSYALSGERVRAARIENKDLEIFLDVHRDSLRKESTTLVVDGKGFARLLFVVGTGHANYESNLLFTEGLNDLLTAKNPGLSKGIIKKDSSQGNGVYNQDVSPNAVIVEIGGVDNTIEEIRRTSEALADVLSDYYWHSE